MIHLSKNDEILLLVCLVGWLVGRSIGLVSNDYHLKHHPIQSMNTEFNSLNNHSDCVCVCFALEFCFLCPWYKFFCSCYFHTVILCLITGPNKKDHAKWRRSGKSSTSCTNHNLYPFLKKKYIRIHKHINNYKNELQFNAHCIHVWMHCNTNMCVRASVCLKTISNVKNRKPKLVSASSSIDMRWAEL